MEMNLDKMTSAELRKIQVDVDAALAERQKQDRIDAKTAAEAAAAEYGFSLDELLTVQKPAKTKAAPKYKNPENPEQTWSGRGRKPAWLADALTAGADMADLEI
ncbi:H-NS family nucleoid-associated regulatory protein [Ruegeria sp. EL01]|uniref:H-NS histone family protein n=1 Tax=Ruegeria sp. EL01 TaxID=2107578 RepID=UPI000EA7F98D|nr:H-NS histone family protein [Ruegeria sp. EL01]